MDTPNTNTPTKNDHQMVMGILAYLGPLVIISYIVSKDDPVVKFHIKQGLVLLCINIILWIVATSMFLAIWPLIQLINFALLVLTVMGIINVVQKRERMLPIVGGLSSYFKF